MLSTISPACPWLLQTQLRPIVAICHRSWSSPSAMEILYWLRSLFSMDCSMRLFSFRDWLCGICILILQTTAFIYCVRQMFNTAAGNIFSRQGCTDYTLNPKPMLNVDYVSDTFLVFLILCYAFCHSQ